MDWKSPELKELAICLAKAQSEFKTAIKDSNNPFHKSKYADWESLIVSTRPSLTAHGFSVIQPIIENEDGKKYLHSILLHVSGQYIQSTIQIVPLKNDPQTLAATVTYLKRMTYAALIGVSIGDDDDGETAMCRNKETKKIESFHKRNTEKFEEEIIEEPNIEEIQYISRDQEDTLRRMLKGHSDEIQITKDLFERLKIDAFSNIQSKYYNSIYKHIENSKSKLDEARKIRENNG